MIRLLMAGLLLCASSFGWASAYPEGYSGVPHDNFQEGDVIDHAKFNANNLSIKNAINGNKAALPPTNCTTDQIIKWDGSAWVCADMPSAGNVVEDGAAYGSPVWVDSNGTVLTGRDNSYTVFILNGAFQLPGRIENGTYRNVTNYAYYLQSGCQGAAYFWPTGSAFVALPGSPNWQVRSGIAGDITYRSRLEISSNSCEEKDPYTSDIYQELLDSGIPAPSWLTDGTEAFRGLR